MTFHQNWIGFDGQPLTGVAPARLISVNGIQPTPAQYNQTAHHFKLFLDAVSVSAFPEGFHVQHRILQDGTKVRMESMQRIARVFIEPGNPDDNKIPWRGFVIYPHGVGSADIGAVKTPMLLRLTDLWRPQFRNYYPSKRDAYLPYLVGRSRTPPRLRMDDKYFDVWCAKDSTLFKNATRAGLASDTGVPIPIGKNIVTLSESKLSILVDGTLTTKYDFEDTHDAPIGTEFSFPVGPDLNRSGPANATVHTAKFLQFDVSSLGGVTGTRADVQVIEASPFVNVAYSGTAYLAAPGSLENMSGLSSSTGSGLAEPLMDPGPFNIGFLYTPNGHWDYTGTKHWVADGNSVYSAPLAGDGLEAHTTGATTKYSYDYTFTTDESFTLGDHSFTVTRYVDVESIQTRNVTSYYATWPYEDALYLGGGGINYDYAYIGQPSTFFGGEINQGDKMDFLVCAEDVRGLDHQEDSFCVISTDLFDGGDLYSVDVTRTHTQLDGWSQVFESETNDWGDERLETAPNQLLMLMRNRPYSTTNADDIPYIENTIEGVARDVLYHDVSNKTSVWIETKIASAASDETEGTGSSAITIEAVVVFNGTTTRFSLYERSADSPLSLSSSAPPGVSFTGSTIYFTYHRMPRPVPIFAPKWREQGLCPYIVYTTQEEHTDAVPVTPRFAMHLRLQMVKTDRGSEDVPAVDDAVQFAPYMSEQLLTNYGGPVNEIFNAFEATPIVLKHAIPDSTLFDNVGMDSKAFARFYRT